MTVKEYREQFIELYKKLVAEHGDISEIRLKDNTKYHLNQIPTLRHFDWIDCTILFI